MPTSPRLHVPKFGPCEGVGWAHAADAVPRRTASINPYRRITRTVADSDRRSRRAQRRDAVTTRLLIDDVLRDRESERTNGRANSGSTLAIPAGHRPQNAQPTGEERQSCRFGYSGGRDIHPRAVGTGGN